MSTVIRSPQSARGLLVSLAWMTPAAISALWAIFGEDAPISIIVPSIAFGLVVGFVFMRRHQDLDPLSPIVSFCLLYFLYLGVGSNNTGYFFGVFVSTTQWLLYLFGLLFYLGGVALAGGYQLSKPKGICNQTDITFRRVTRRRNAIAVFGIASFILSFAASGIPIFSNVDTSRFLFTSPLGPFWPFTIRLVVAAAIVSTVLYYANSAPGLKRWHHLIIGFICVVTLTFLGSRAFLIPILVSGLVSRAFLLRRFRISSLMTGGLVALIVLSMFASFRNSSESSNAEHFLQKQLTKYGLPSSSFQLLGSAYLYTLNGPHVLAKIIQMVPETIPYQYGGFFFREASTILPGKQLLPDQWIALNIVKTRTVQASGRMTHLGQGGGIPPTLLGGFYLDFGWFGVALGMLMVGFVLQVLYRRVVARTTAFDVGIYGCALSYFLISIYSMVTFRFSEVAQWLFVAYALWPIRGCVIANLCHDESRRNG